MRNYDIKIKRQYEINLEKHQDFVPSIIIKDPIYCFEGISTKDELNFILNLNDEQWGTICDNLYERYFYEFTDFFKDYIFSTFSEEFEKYKNEISQN